MRLTTITLTGFKSFAKKTVIDVRKNITGIVGPNGSGKSNIAEAIRFVLGEQSMKSMRGGSSSDLVFKGSGTLPALGRASVSLTLKNEKKGTFAEASDKIAPFLAYEEIVLAREVFADGGSDYTINGAKVRLKDVAELLALAGIGENKHTILSQGEADRVLLVSPKERKLLIEDALGLKVFQLRIEESKKKIEKTHKHLDEVKLLEKEIKPHFHYLERQLEKIKKYEEEKERLRDSAHAFIYLESQRLKEEKKHMREVGSTDALTLLLSTVEKDIENLTSSRKVDADSLTERSYIHTLKKDLASLEREYSDIHVALSVLESERARILAEIASSEKGESITYKEEERLAFRSELLSHIDGMRDGHEREDHDAFYDEYDKSKLKLNSFLRSDNRGSQRHSELVKQLTEKENDISFKTNEKTRVGELRASKEKHIRALEEKEEKEREHVLENERKLYTLRAKASELRGLIMAQKEKESSHQRDSSYIAHLIQEVTAFLGDEAKEYAHIKKESSLSRFDLQKLVERSKLRLEEGAVSGAEELRSEYEKTKERITYLHTEIENILQSEKELYSLIDDITAHMKEEYERGFESVSIAFSKYFETVFPGGEAQLQKKVIKETGDDGEELEKGEGVDIDVKLPSKKVKSINAFSGGEKALTSIALLFALCEVSPPPFIVLDETDAPLDEHNAKKYGETLVLLSEKSKLLVITHNRETMSHCEMLYGVTIGTDGASKLLSVDLK